MKKVLGILHITVAVITGLFLFLNIVPLALAIIACVYLIAKGIAFGLSKGIFLSYLDAVFGSLLLLAVAGVFSNVLLNAISIIFLLQKGASYWMR